MTDQRSSTRHIHGRAAGVPPPHFDFGADSAIAIPIARQSLPPTRVIHSERSIASRIGDGLVRRAMRAWRAIAPAEADAASALAYLEQYTWAAQQSGSLAQLTPDLAAGLIVTAQRFGARELVAPILAGLLASQRTDGGFATGRAQHPSLVTTAAALTGLLAAGTEHSHARFAAFRAGRLLMQAVREPSIQTSGLAQADPHMHFVWLAALARAAEELDEPRWRAESRAAIDRLATSTDLPRWRTHVAWHAAVAEALVELDLRESACAAMRWPMALERRNGSLAALPGDGSATSISATAHFAEVCFHLGRVEAGNRAMGWLRRSAGFVALADPESFAGRTQATAEHWHSQWHPGSESVWEAKRFLDASRAQVAATFAGEQHPLPREIDPRDGRLVAVLDWCAELPRGATLLDAGCGTGRFLTHIARARPDLHLFGLEPSAALRAELPEFVTPVAGELLAIFQSTASVDAVLAIESLEHALIPERAAKELCRVLKPGGQLLIIDKHRRYQPLSHHEPWEQWFAPEQLLDWLGPHCRDAACAPVPAGSVQTRGQLFWAWRANRASPAPVARLARAA